MQNHIRNIAIIAHVDHGKTTLVDALLKQSQNFHLKSGAPTDLIMDSSELERERGITIFSKNAAVIYGDTKINIVDTPGHADFGGEVERIMRMVDGALLLVDAKEGPMPQTKFVLKKAIQAGHKVIVVINKIDKPDARPDWVLNKTFDLFVELGGTEAQIDFPVLYASGLLGRAGWASRLENMSDVRPVFEAIIETIPPPQVTDRPLQMLTVNLLSDNYKGKIAVGRLYSGTLRRGMNVAHINRAGGIKKATLSAVMVFEGLATVEKETVMAGDIVAVAGIADVSIGETIADLNRPEALPVIQIEEPTVKMNFSVNTSPLSGREGRYVTSRHLRERLLKETETDVALRLTPATPDTWVVAGRGELHLSILIEKMRREGFELQVSRPQVIFKEIDGRTHEPIERVMIEVPEAFTGTVMENMGARRGEMVDMRVVSSGGGTQSGGNAYLEFLVPTRGLIGLRNQLLTQTKGQAVINSLFEEYASYKGDIDYSAHGSLVASIAGITRAYGLMNAQERGELFIAPGVSVYAGMIVGQNAKALDLRVNVTREKKLSNMRAKSDGAMEFLKVPRTLTLEEAIEYIGEDELVEVTPSSIRLRKLYLTEADEKYAPKT